MHTSYLVDLLSILSMHTIRTIRTIRMHTLLILASSSRSTRVCILATLVVGKQVAVFYAKQVL